MKKTQVLRGVVGVVCASILLAASLCADPVPYNITKDKSLYRHLDQRKVPVIGNCACAPTSAVNSFVYLQKKYPQLYDSKLIGDPDNEQQLINAVTALGELMGTTCPGGTADAMMAYGKAKYIEDNIPGVTKYRAMDNGTWGAPGAKPAWFEENTYPTWKFIYEELKACEDVEIGFTRPDNSGHWVTVYEFKFTDTDNDGEIDAGETATLGFIDPWGGTDNVGTLTQDASGHLVVAYGNDAGTIDVAISESPIPEPMTVGLLGMGLSVVTWLRRRRRRG